MQLRGLKPNMIVIHVTTQTLYRITRVNIGLDNIVSFVTAADDGQVLFNLCPRVHLLARNPNELKVKSA